MRWHTQNLSYDRLPTWRHGRCGAPTAPGSDCYCQHHLDTPASVSSDAAPQGGERCAHVPLGFEDDECSECEEKPVVAVLESGEQLCFVCFGKRFDEMAAKLTTERDRPLDPEPVAGRFSGIGKLASVAAHPPRSAPAERETETQRIGFAVWDEGSPTLIEDNDDRGTFIHTTLAAAESIVAEHEGYEVVEVHRRAAPSGDRGNG
jgi:hypothetical protein